MVDELLQEIRDAGWMVAVHNDYKLNGEFYTFWLFTKHYSKEFMISVKGEGKTDLAALAEVKYKISLPADYE